ncbi:MAG: hypothetical protein ACRBEQ_00175 [Hyphomonas sp.]
MAKAYPIIRKVHSVLGAIVGVQIVLWIASGLFFTLFPIGQIRGDYLRAPLSATISAPEDGFVAMETVAGTGGGEVERVELRPFPGGAVYEVKTSFGVFLHDAASGDVLSPLDDKTARRVVLARWAGRGELSDLSLVADAPAESGGKGREMWKADFEGVDKATFWVDPYTGKLTAVRTPLWRTFDLMWGLHIMDWQNRETFTSWWIKLTAFASLVFVFSGIWLVVRRILRGTLLV